MSRPTDCFGELGRSRIGNEPFSYPGVAVSVFSARLYLCYDSNPPLVAPLLGCNPKSCTARREPHNRRRTSWCQLRQNDAITAGVVLAMLGSQTSMSIAGGVCLSAESSISSSASSTHSCVPDVRVCRKHQQGYQRCGLWIGDHDCRPHADHGRWRRRWQSV